MVGKVQITLFNIQGFPRGEFFILVGQRLADQFRDPAVPSREFLQICLAAWIEILQAFFQQDGVVKEPVGSHEIQIRPVSLDGIMVAQMIRFLTET